MPCPTPTCLWVLRGAILCLALGWLAWAPTALRGRALPRVVVWAVVAVTVAGCVLAAGVATFACSRCGGF